MLGRYRPAAIVAACSLAVFLAGCAVIDAFDDRADTYNRSAARYANMAEFLNVLRASQFEPLNFVTFSSATGHNTLTGNVGFPAVNIGPNQTPAQHIFTFGANSASRSATNDFTMTNVDDPGSYAALMTPINPAVIGFFIEQGYPRELLFALFIDQLKISGTGGTEIDINNPNDPSFKKFGGRLSDLLVSGLTAQIDATAVPSAQAIPPYKFCIDPDAPLPGFAGQDKDVVTPTCRGQAWQKKASSPKTTWTFKNRSEGFSVDVSLRSTYGVYAHLGRIVRFRGNIDNIVGTAGSGDTKLFTVTNDVAGCFIQTDFNGVHYCVPESANNTKRVFSLLRQLVGLKITPTNPPPTQTVRTTN